MSDSFEVVELVEICWISQIEYRDFVCVGYSDCLSCTSRCFGTRSPADDQITGLVEKPSQYLVAIACMECSCFSRACCPVGMMLSSHHISFFRRIRTDASL